MNSEDFIITAQNLKMPKIIYGTAWKKAATAHLVEAALTAGFRGVDTACQPKHYHEPGVGDGIMACINKGFLNRADLYVQTKFTPIDGQDPDRIPYDPKASLADQVRQSLQTSLMNLKTNYLDCLVLHSPLSTWQDTIAVWNTMEGFVDEGIVKQLGISNCYDLKMLSRLYDAARWKPAVIQNRFYQRTDYDRALRAYCIEHDIIYQSFWTLTANPHMLSSATIKKIADHYQRSPEQILFRYLTQIGIVPLTGTTSIAHMQEDLAIFEFTLDDNECNEIWALF